MQIQLQELLAIKIHLPYTGNARSSVVALGFVAFRLVGRVLAQIDIQLAQQLRTEPQLPEDVARLARQRGGKQAVPVRRARARLHHGPVLHKPLRLLLVPRFEDRARVLGPRADLCDLLRVRRAHRRRR